MSTSSRVRVLVELGLQEPVPVYTSTGLVYLREDGRRIEPEHEVIFVGATVDSAGGVTCREVMARQVYADGSRARTPILMKDPELWQPPAAVRDHIVAAAANAAREFAARAAYWLDEEKRS